MDKNFTVEKYLKKSKQLADIIVARLNRGNVRSQLSKDLTRHDLDVLAAEADQAMKRLETALN